MHSIVTTGIVLKRLDYGESDRIITVLTKDHGKVSLLAKGVRKEKSKLAGGIELFSISELTYIDGKSDLKTLTSSRLVQHFDNVVKDLDKTMFGYEVLKIMNKLAEGQDDGALHRITTEVLTALHAAELSLEVVSTWFYVHMLSALGMDIELHQDAQGNELDQSKTYTFDASAMMLSPHERGTITAQHIKLLRVIQACVPSALGKVQQINSLIAECLPVAKNAFMYHHNSLT